eukprot:jgi/Tetstr1/447901/TSEL_035209.t1
MILVDVELAHAGEDVVDQAEDAADEVLAAGGVKSPKRLEETEDVELVNVAEQAEGAGDEAHGGVEVDSPKRRDGTEDVKLVNFAESVAEQAEHAVDAALGGVDVDSPRRVDETGDVELANVGEGAEGLEEDVGQGDALPKVDLQDAKAAGEDAARSRSMMAGAQDAAASRGDAEAGALAALKADELSVLRKLVREAAASGKDVNALLSSLQLQPAQEGSAGAGGPPVLHDHLRQ